MPLRSWGQGMRKLSEVVETLCILTGVWVTKVDALSKLNKYTLKICEFHCLNFTSEEKNTVNNVNFSNDFYAETFRCKLTPAISYVMHQEIQFV